MADVKPLVTDSGLVRNSASGDVVVVPGLKDSALTSTRIVLAGVDGVLTDSPLLTTETVCKDNDILMPTNPFGGRQLYYNILQNAFFRAGKRWVVTAAQYNKSDDTLYSTYTAIQIATLFDGNYDSRFLIQPGKYAKINITFSTEAGGTFPVPPYGYFFVSHYWDSCPSAAITNTDTVRVYCNYIPQTVGWKTLNLTDFLRTAGEHNVITYTYNSWFAVSEIEFKLSADDVNLRQIVQFDWKLDRPGSAEMPYVDKFKANTLYDALTVPNIISNVAPGTAPYATTSNTVNTNLNADLWDGYHTSDTIVSNSFSGIFGDVAFGTCASIYPTQDDTHVKATSKASTNFWPYYSTDPAQSLTGSWVHNNWISSTVTNQRFHIDLGSACVITRIYYENGHNSGGDTDNGAKNFTVWGSNTAGDFADLTYSHDGTWTQLTPSQSFFEQHVASDQADPKYIQINNSTAYRYYAIKIADNWGASWYIGLRRIVLQGSPTPVVSINSVNRQLYDSTGGTAIDYSDAGIVVICGANVTSTLISNWNTAYGWGNHASAGYLTSQISHTDVIQDGDFTSQGILLRGATAGSYAILTDNSSNWNTAYGWGNHAGLYDATGAASTVQGNLGTHASLTTTAHGLGASAFHADAYFALAGHNHSGVYDPTGTAASAVSSHESTYNHSNYNTAYGWGDWRHTTLSGYGITDACPLAHKTTEDALNGIVKCNGSGTYSTVTDNSSNWNTAYGWGNHASAGYFVKASDTLDNITAGSTNVHLTATLKSAYDGAVAHKTTEDALNGVVMCNGAGTYSAATNTNLPKSASDTLRHSHDDYGYLSNSSTWTKVKTITFTDGLLGMHRYKFDFDTNTNGHTAYAELRKNGTLIGNSQSTVAYYPSYTTVSQDLLVSYAAGDTCELWVKSDGGAGISTTYKNFRIYYDNSISITVASSNS